MKRHAVLTSTFTDVLDCAGTLTLSSESPSGAHREPLMRRARGVAFVTAILLSIGMSPIEATQKMQFNSSKELIKYVAQLQLSDKEYKCHNEIIYRESRWNDRAVGNKNGKKQAHGLYQMKIASMKNAHVELQFWKYWGYVMHRYGVTPLDEPAYCVALNHLKNKGWQ